MPRELLHIYGPFAIHWYGVMILFGVLIFFWRASQNPIRKKYLTEEQFINCLVSITLVGMTGGRLLYIFEEWGPDSHISDIFKVWEGGFSLLGGIAILVPFVPWYVWRHKIPFLPTVDLAGLYTPLTQAFSRIGCFLAGCCYGTSTVHSWGTICIDPYATELYGKLVHPTQLYSAFALALIFLVVRYVVYPRAAKQGQICAWYLILVSLERFVLDFWRGDRIVAHTLYVSNYQLIACSIMLFGFGMLIFCTFVKPKSYEHL